MAQAHSLSLKAVAAGYLTGLEKVFISSGSRIGFYAVTKASMGPGGQDAAAWVLHPSGSNHQSLACSYLKSDRNKTDLEKSYNFLPCSLLQLIAHLHKHRLEWVWAHRDPLASIVCLSLGDTWQNRACKCYRGPSLASVRRHRALLQLWLGALLYADNAFTICRIIHSFWIFETVKTAIYWSLSYIGRQQGHIVRVREGSGLCPPPPAPHGQVPHGDLSYSREPMIRGTGACFCQEAFAELRLTYWGKQQTLPDHINKPSLWASM